MALSNKEDETHFSSSLKTILMFNAPAADAPDETCKEDQTTAHKRAKKNMKSVDEGRDGVQDRWCLPTPYADWRPFSEDFWHTSCGGVSRMDVPIFPTHA